MKLSLPFQFSLFLILFQRVYVNCAASEEYHLFEEEYELSDGENYPLNSFENPEFVDYPASLLSALDSGPLEALNMEALSKYHDLFIRCIRMGDLETLELLLSKPQINFSGLQSCWEEAIKAGSCEIIKLFLSNDFDPSLHSNAAFRFAVEWGDFEVVKMLKSDDRVDPAACSNDSIRMASLLGHTDIVKLLLEDERVDPTVFRNTPIRNAAEAGHLETLKLLLSDARTDHSDHQN